MAKETMYLLKVRNTKLTPWLLFWGNCGYQHFCLISGFIDAWIWIICLRVNIPSAEFNEKVQSEIILTCLVGIMTIKGKNEGPQRLLQRVSDTSFAAGL